MNFFSTVNIPVFGSVAEAVSWTAPPFSAEKGVFFSDVDWLKSTNVTRSNGVVEGIARSVDYNTVLRQVSTMCSVFSNILAYRNGAGGGAKTGAIWYGGAPSIPPDGTVIGTDLSASGSENIEEHIGALSDIFNINFLFDNEVVTRMINEGAVTTPKIANFNVTLDKLANGSVSRAKLSETLLGTGATGSASVESTQNGITVRLLQSTSQGAGRGITISLISSAVTKATNADKLSVVQGGTGKVYFAGPTGIGATPTNRSLVAMSGVYVEGGTTLNAATFNVPSDERLKDGIEPLGKNQVKALVEKVDAKTFYYKNNPKKTYVGIIAQDLQKANTVIGDLLVDKDEDGILSVQESKLTYILWDYVKQLEARVSALEKRLGDK